MKKEDWDEFQSGNQAPFLKKFEEQLLRKTKDWETENEWRFMIHNSDTSLKICKHKLSEGAISKIYIGLKCDRAKCILSQAKRKFSNAAVLQAIKPRGKIALEFKEL